MFLTHQESFLPSLFPLFPYFSLLLHFLSCPQIYKVYKVCKTPTKVPNIGHQVHIVAMELFNTTFFTDYENMELKKNHKNLHAYHVL